jgi:hypothetical protein
MTSDVGHHHGPDKEEDLHLPVDRLISMTSVGMHTKDILYHLDNIKQNNRIGTCANDT